MFSNFGSLRQKPDSDACDKRKCGINFAQAGSVTSRAARVVSPTMKQMSDDVKDDLKEMEESRLETDEQDQFMLHGVDDEN